MKIVKMTSLILVLTIQNQVLSKKTEVYPEPYIIFRSTENVVLLNEMIRHQGDNIDGIAELIRQSNNINEFDQSGNTALHIAIMLKNQEVVEMLLFAGAQVNLADQFGWTPLLHAISVQSDEITRLLLEHGVSINGPISEGLRSPIHYATCWEVAHLNFILSYNPNVNAVDEQGRTALHLAAASNHPEMIKILLEHGADRTIKDVYERLPWDLTRDQECFELLKIIPQ